MRNLKYKKLHGLLGLTLIFSCPAFSSSFLKAEDCGNCTYDEAKKIAESETPEMDCVWDIPPNTQPEVGDSQLCYAKPQTIVIISPTTQKAYKFRTQKVQINANNPRKVQSRTDVQDLTLSDNENGILASYYSLENTLSQSIENASAYAYVTQSNATKFSVMNVAGSSGDGACDALKFFKNNTEKEALYKEFTDNIIKEMQGSSWSDFIDSEKVNGVGLSIGLTEVGFNISFTHKDNDIFVTKAYGGTKNVLAFKAQYHGSVILDPGHTNGRGFTVGRSSTINLAYNLDLEGSHIDGIRGDELFSNKGNLINLTDRQDVSQCLKDFIEDNSEEIRPDSGGTFPGVPHSITDGGSDGFIHTCVRRMTTYWDGHQFSKGSVIAWGC